MADQESNAQRNASIRLQNKHQDLQNLSILASALSDELEELLKEKLITPDQAQAIYRKFMQSYQEQWDILINQQGRIEGSMTANLDVYRFFDDTADLELSDVRVQYTTTGLAKDPNRKVKTTDKLFIKALDEDIVLGKKMAP